MVRCPKNEESQSTVDGTVDDSFYFCVQVIDNLGPLELILNTPSHHRVHHGMVHPTRVSSPSPIHYVPLFLSHHG